MEVKDILGSTGFYYACRYGHLKIVNLLIQNNVFHNRMKHIDIAYHYTRSRVKAGDVKIHHLPSKDNIADFFTKPVRKNTFRKFCKKIRLT